MIDYKDFILIEDKDGYIYPKYNIYCNNCGVSRGYIKPYKGCEERLCRSCGNKGEMSEKHKENIRKSIIKYYKDNKIGYIRKEKNLNFLKKGILLMNRVGRELKGNANTETRNILLIQDII